MYSVLLACTIEYNSRILSSMPVWSGHSEFEIEKVVYDGNEALACLRSRSFDLFITELDMVGMDGLGLLRIISQEDLCPLVVLLSDTVQFQYVRESLLFGAFDYLKKMPDKQVMLELLKRAGESLVSNNRNKPYLNELGYPKAEEDEIVSELIIHSDKVIDLFNKTFDRIYSNEKERWQENDILVRELYQNIVNRVFKSQPWLHNYVSSQLFQKIDYLWAGSLEGFRDYYVRKLTELKGYIDDLMPATNDKSLHELIMYILQNPQEDLRLKSISSKMYLNYSYLSNNFSTKIPLHYSEYILRVKMARSAYLLAFTDMRIYEICSVLSYQDTNYFTRLFRRFYDTTPSAYREKYQASITSLDYSCL